MLQAEDKSIAPKLDVLNWVTALLAAIVVGLRIYSKYRSRARLWWDDYIAIVSWVSVESGASIVTWIYPLG